MKKSKVLMFGWEYAPYISGGLGVVTRSIIQNLLKQGMEIVFVLPRVPSVINEKVLKIINASKIQLETEDYKLLSKVSIEDLVGIFGPYFHPDTDLHKYFQELDMDNISQGEFARKMKVSDDFKMYGPDLFYQVDAYAERSAKIAESNPHDIIHTHDWMTAKAGMKAKEVSDAPMIMHVHATEFDRTGGNPNQKVYDIEREGMQKSDKIIAVSELTKQKIMQNYGVTADKIEVVHNAIDKYPRIKKFGDRLNKTDKIVLFLGRLTQQKGADYLLEAAEKVLRDKRRVKFVFVGHGDMLKYLIRRSIDLGIQKKVMFTGFMNHDDVDKAYQMADLYVMPSVSEPFGITALESIQNGTPVIISKQSGVSEVIKNALKVDFWDTDELANKILGVIRYETLGISMAKNAEEELDKISWDKQTEKIVNVYNQIMGQ